MLEQMSYALVFIAGAASSFINIMAGGGSVLTLSIMMLLGLDAPVANGTNRIGLLIESISGAAAYSRENPADTCKSVLYGVCAIPGAVIGSIFAINMSNEMFQRILSVIMVFIVFTLILPGSKQQSLNAVSKARSLALYPVMFLIGLYGGFIQVGIGFIIMFALRWLTRLNLVDVNRYKVFIVLVYTMPVLVIFGFTRNIDWGYALVLGLGNALGAWLSVRISLKRGERAVKIVLCVAILLLALKFFL